MSRFLHLVRHGEAVDDGPLSPRGRRQAESVGHRLTELPIVRLYHGPLPRAAQTAQLASRYLPSVPVRACELVGDYFPPVPDPAALPEAYARFLRDVTDEEYTAGARLAAAAVDRYAVPAEADIHEVIITHDFLIGWFVRHAMGAPAWRWLGLDQANAALTTIRYSNDRPPTLVVPSPVAPAPRASGTVPVSSDIFPHRQVSLATWSWFSVSEL